MNFKRKTLIFIFLQCFHQSISSAQCSAPALTHDSNDELCANTALHVNITPVIPAGCALAIGSPYELQNATTNTIIRYAAGQNTLAAATPGSYSARINLRQDPASAQTCPCIGYSAYSNIIVVNTVPNTPTVTGRTDTCLGNPLVLTANSLTNGIFIWTDQSGNQTLFQGNPFNTQPLNSSSTTFKVYEKIGNCRSTSASITVTAASLALPNVPVNDTMICNGDAVVLTASHRSSNSVLRWFSSNSQQPIYVGNAFQTPALSANTTYYVDAEEGNCHSNRVSVTVRMRPAPSLSAPVLTRPMSSDTTLCVGESVSLAAAGRTANTQIRWYNAAGTQLLATANVFQTPNLNIGTSYLVEAAEGNCRSARMTVTVNVTATNLALPTVSLADSICSGDAAILTASLANRPNSMMRWYDAVGTQLLMIGNRFTTPALTATTMYQVEATDGLCKSPKKPVTVSVRVLPHLSLPVVTPLNPTICPTDNVVFADSTNNNPNSILRWYILGQNNVLHIGNSYQTPNLMASTNYQVERVEGNCRSSRVDLAVTVRTNPSLPSPSFTTPAQLCPDTSVLLTAYAPNVTTYNWYSDAAGNNLLYQGNRFQTPVLRASTLFYVQTVKSGCRSERMAVPVFIAPNPDLHPISSNAPICEQDTLKIWTETTIAKPAFYWTTPGGTESSRRFEIPNVVKNQHEGVYKLRVKNTETGCISSSYETIIKVNFAPKVNTAATISVSDGETIQLFASGGDRYQWLPSTHLNHADIPNPVFKTELTSSNSTHFDYTLTVSNTENRCQSQAKVRVIVLPKTQLVINNVLTPNGDGENDEWEIDYIYNLKDYTIAIFDRLGNIVYTQTNDYQTNKWNGRHSKTNELLPEGTYWYRIAFNGGQTLQPITGAITLIFNQEK
jgi:gliding motility-associated-like protein